MPGSPRPDPERLTALVRAEARRALEGTRLEADPARTAAGWERRFVIELPRVEELRRLYEELGYEVVADPLPPAATVASASSAPSAPAEGCDACPVAGALEFRMVYTRRRRPN